MLAGVYIILLQLDLSELARDKVSGQTSAEIRRPPMPAYPNFRYMFVCWLIMSDEALKSYWLIFTVEHLFDVGHQLLILLPKLLQVIVKK